MKTHIVICASARSVQLTVERRSDLSPLGTIQGSPNLFVEARKDHVCRLIVAERV